MDQGMADDGVYGGAGSKADAGGEDTAVQRQAGELATVTLSRCFYKPLCRREKKTQMLSALHVAKQTAYCI